MDKSGVFGSKTAISPLVEREFGDLYTATLTNTGRQVIAFLGDECDYLPEEDTKWPNQ